MNYNIINLHDGVEAQNAIKELLETQWKRIRVDKEIVNGGKTFYRIKVIGSHYMPISFIDPIAALKSAKQAEARR